jgi:CheY-like chemotaxis protein
MSSPPDISPEGMTRRRPHLLVVDDLSELRLLVRLMGTRGGLDVVCCADVPAGWEAIQQQRPDLVLLDMNLPGLHGLELFRRIQVTPELRRLRVALFGSYDLTGDLAAAIEAGIRFVVSKELVSRPGEWLERVREILAVPDGQAPRCSLGCVGGDTSLPSPDHWIDNVQKALRQGAVRRLGLTVLRIVRSRALQDAWARFPPEGLPPECLSDGWLLPDDGFHPGNPLLASMNQAAVAALAAHLADRITCLLGAQASRSCRTVLAALAPGLSQDMGNE